MKPFYTVDWGEVVTPQGDYSWNTYRTDISQKGRAVKIGKILAEANPSCTVRVRTDAGEIIDLIEPKAKPKTGERN